jgi:hypothetical protein
MQKYTPPSAGPAANISAHKAPRNNAPVDVRNLSTEALAVLLLVREQTIRAGYCRDGHYLGLVPIKLPNRRLLWDADEVDALIAGRPVKTPDAADLEKHVERKAAAKIPEHIRRKTTEKLKRLAAAATTSEVAQ